MSQPAARRSYAMTDAFLRLACWEALEGWGTTTKGKFEVHGMDARKKHADQLFKWCKGIGQ